MMFVPARESSLTAQHQSEDIIPIEEDDSNPRREIRAEGEVAARQTRDAQGLSRPSPAPAIARARASTRASKYLRRVVDRALQTSIPRASFHQF